MQVFFLILMFVLIMCVLAMTLTAQVKKANEKSSSAAERIKTLEQGATAKTTMINNLSHDVRTPISNIQRMSSQARRAENMDEIMECLDRIDADTARILKYVDDMLNLNNFEEGKIIFDTKPMNLSALANDCTETFKNRLVNHKIAVLCDFSALSVPVLKVDDQHLRQVILNIMALASKYVGRGGRIKFSMSELENNGDKVNVRFEIEDNGPGMPQEILEHLFDSSVEYSVDKKSHRSTSLGMPMTKKLVEMMGGEIRVDSEIGHGCKFTFDIPFTIPDEEIE